MTNGGQQVTREQRTTQIALLAVLAVQAALSFARADPLALALPALGLGIATAVLTLRSDSRLQTLQRKRALLAAISSVLACLFVITLFVDDPRSLALFQISRIVVIDCAFLGLGQLCASLIAGRRPAHG